MTLPASDRDAIDAEIGRIRSLGIDELRARWRATFRSSPPPAFTKDLVARFLCWHIQEQAFGGLDPDIAKFLDGLARGDKPRVDRRLKPGTVLVREYQGERHTVTVVSGGYLWRDTTYTSLSTVARAITGTAWNGHRFFGLVPGCPGAGVRSALLPATSQSAQRCRDEAHRTQGLSLRDLHSQIDRA